MHNHNSYENESRYRMGINYAKNAVWVYNQRQTRREDEEVWRPFTPQFSVPESGVNSTISCGSTTSVFRQHGGSKSDVWTTENLEIGQSIKPLLEDLANSTNDCPLPRYQMIIDPNQFVRPRLSDGQKVWVPCEFDIAMDGSAASLVGGDRAHWMDSATVDHVATPVLTAALPLLAKLAKPYLLLEGQRLQVVVKAQTITVPKKQPDDDAPEYVGLWHIDGEHEPVVAVVLYYYDVDEALVGGNMELMDCRPLAVLGVGDTSMPEELVPGSLREALRPRSTEEPRIPNCSVPIKTGTLLVFSNYQMAHRVLRMVNSSQDRAASRKFVALFVMDPAAERLVPASAHLAHSYLFKRALTGEAAAHDSLPDPVADIILEFLGIVPSLCERRRTRNELLRGQLIPKHTLGASEDMVCSTGNGCLTMIGWIDSLLIDYTRKRSTDWTGGAFDMAESRVNAMNFAPKEVGRGLSETLSIPSENLDLPSFYDTLDDRNAKLNQDFDKML